MYLTVPSVGAADDLGDAASLVTGTKCVSKRWLALAWGLTLLLTLQACGESQIMTNQASNQVPTASISSPAQDLTISLGEAVDFQGTASDADGSVVAHYWAFGDGNTASLEDPGAHPYADTGTYGVTYQVTDNQGATSATATRIVTVVTFANEAPSASIDSPGQDVTVTLGTAVSFEGSASDPDGWVVSHSWVFGNGATASVEDPGAYTFPAAGTFSVAYRVIDNLGVQSPIALRTVTVVPVVPPPPATVLFQDGSENSDFASRGWYDFGAWVQTTSQAHSGTGALEMRFNQGAQQPVGGGGRHLFDETESLYFGYWVKYSTNWVGSGDAYNPHEFLFLTNADDVYAGPAWTGLTVYVEHVHQGGGNVPTVRASDRRNIDQSRINQDLSAITEERGANGCNGNTDGHSTACWDVGGGTYWNEKTWSASQPYFLDSPGPGYKGDWHFVETYVRLNSLQGVALTDGVVQYWSDGQLVLAHQDVLLRTGASPTMRFNQLLIGLWISDGSPVGQTMWIDDLTIGTARPTTP